MRLAAQNNRTGTACSSQNTGSRPAGSAEIIPKNRQNTRSQPADSGGIITKNRQKQGHDQQVQLE